MAMTKLECEIDRIKDLIARLDTESMMAVLSVMNLCGDAIDLLAEVDVAEVPANAYWKKQVTSMVSEWGTRIKADQDEPPADN